MNFFEHSRTRRCPIASGKISMGSAKTPPKLVKPPLTILVGARQLLNVTLVSVQRSCYRQKRSVKEAPCGQCLTESLRAATLRGNSAPFVRTTMTGPPANLSADRASGSMQAKMQACMVPLTMRMISVLRSVVAIAWAASMTAASIGMCRPRMAPTLTANTDLILATKESSVLMAGTPMSWLMIVSDRLAPRT